MFQKSLFLLLAFLTAVAGATLYDGYRPDKATSPTEKTAKASTKSITVYVTGAVENPGMITLTEDARLADAIDFCGGVLPNAATDSLNMARKISDGERINIPSQRQKEKSSLSDVETSEKNKNPKKSLTSAVQNPAVGAVNINTADERELDALPGIGPAIAKRIIEFRQTEGLFTAPEDIKKVRGIGEVKFQKLKDLITI